MPLRPSAPPAPTSEADPRSGCAGVVDARAVADMRLACWQEWRAVCAAALCGPDTHDYLVGFANHRFQHLASRCDRAAQQPGGWLRALPGTEACQRFETHLAVHATRAGKCYKDWLFARTRHSADAPLDVIQGGATLILRAVVRDYLRHERPSPRTLSLQAPLADAESAFTIEDLLADTSDPANDVALREYERLASGLAEEVFEALNRRERVALAAKTVGVALSHAAVAALTDCGKTALNRAYHMVLERLAATVRSRYPAEDNASQLTLTEKTLAKLKERILLWKDAENGVAAGFMIAEAEVSADNPNGEP